jgi:hypothetical protein
MNYKLLLLGAFWLLIAQTSAWYQTNSQFLSNWFREHTFLTIIIFALPIGYSYIESTRIMVAAFEGDLWPTRLLGFAIGIVSFTFLTYYHLGEPLTLKTGVTLLLALFIVLIQIFY